MKDTTTKVITEPIHFGCPKTTADLDDLYREREEYDPYLRIIHVYSDVYVPDSLRDRPFKNTRPTLSFFEIIQNVDKELVGMCKDDVTLNYALHKITTNIENMGYNVSSIHVTFNDTEIPIRNKFVPSVFVFFNDKVLENIVDIL